MSQIKDIIELIKNSLTGNQEKDLAFLEEKYDYYKEMNNSEQLLKILSEMIVTIKPLQSEEKIINAIEMGELNFEQAIKIIENDFKTNKLLDAEIILKALIANFEKTKPYKNNAQIEYKSFNNLFEELIYKNKNLSTRKVVNIKENFSHIYFMYSTILILKEDYKNAISVLKKATAWNPINTSVFLNCCEIFKIKQEDQKLKDMMVLALQTAYTKDTISNCYRNLAFYYNKIENFEMSEILYLLSLEYNQNNVLTKKEFELFKNKYSKLSKLPEKEKLIDIFERENIQLGINNELINIAKKYQELCSDIHNIELESYFKNIHKSIDIL